MLKHIVFITEKKLPDMEALKIECDCRKIALHFYLPEEDTLIEETVYITDKEEICKGLLEEGAAVLAWLHEENKEENLSSSSYAVENIEEVDLFYRKDLSKISKSSLGNYPDRKMYYSRNDRRRPRCAISGIRSSFYYQIYGRII